MIFKIVKRHLSYKELLQLNNSKKSILNKGKILGHFSKLANKHKMLNIIGHQKMQIKLQMRYRFTTTRTAIIF